MRKRIFALTAVMALMLSLFAGGAVANSPDDWEPANAGATLFANGIVKLDTRDAEATPQGTSLEAADLGIEVVEGDVVAFDYLLQGATCGGGQPRVFIELNGNFYNTFDGNPNACGVNHEDGWRTVSFTIPESGTVGEAGIVFDNPSDRGVAYFRDLIIGDAVVLGQGERGPAGPQGDRGARGPAGDGFRAEEYCAVVFAAAEDDHLVDSMVVSALAALLPGPVVVVGGPDHFGGQPDDAVDVVNEHNVDHALIAGGTAAVSADYEDALEDAGVDVVRLGGANRVQTSLEIADYGEDFLAGTTTSNDYCG